MKTIITPTQEQVDEIAKFDHDFIPAESFDWNHLMELREIITRKSGFTIVIDHEETYLHPSARGEFKYEKFQNRPMIKGVFRAIYSAIIHINHPEK